MRNAIALCSVSAVVGMMGVARATPIYSDSMTNVNQTDLNGSTPDTTDSGGNKWTAPTAQAGPPTVTPFYRSSTGTTIAGAPGNSGGTVAGADTAAYLPISLTQGNTYSTSVTYTLLANGATENESGIGDWVALGLTTTTPNADNFNAYNDNSVFLLIRTASGGGQNEGDLQYQSITDTDTGTSGNGDGGTLGSSHTLTITITPDGTSSDFSFYEDGNSIGTLTLQGAESSFTDVMLIGQAAGTAHPGAFGEAVASNFTFSQVPEPGMLSLLGLGAGGMLVRRRRQTLG